MFEIFQYSFIVRALIAGIAIAFIAPLIGTFLVIRRYSLITDTLAHISLLGVVIGLIFRIYPLFTAVLISILAGFLIEMLRRIKKLPPDSILALFLSGSLAFAITLISLKSKSNIIFFNFLFGSISTIDTTDIYFILILALFSILTIILLYREMFLISLDEEIARAGGIKVDFLNAIFIFLTALSVSLAIKIVGALLIGALIVIPVITSLLFKKSFFQTIIISLFISVFSVLIGFFVSYYFNLPSGGAIVIITLITFTLILFLKK